MKKILLTKDRFALVDSLDYGWLNQWKWHVNSRGYAAREQYLGGGRKNKITQTILMHRLINSTPDDLETDHINGDRLDNRRINLRSCTRAENQRNKCIQRNNTTGYKNITRNGKYWQVQVVAGNKRFSTQMLSLEKAIERRDIWLSRYHEEYANGGTT